MMLAFLFRKVKVFLVNLRAPPKNLGDVPKMLGVDVCALDLLANLVLSFV